MLTTDHPNRLILGLTGKARSGKDTVGDYLTQHHGFTRVAFADAIKQAAYALDPIVDVDTDSYRYRAIRLSEIVDEVGWENAKDTVPEIRRTLQRIGSDAGWEIHGKNLWIDRLTEHVDLLPGDPPIVITDVRFPAELNWVRDRQGLLINIHRPHNTDLTGDLGTHSSENQSLHHDLTILNDSTLEVLYARVDAIVDRHTSRT